MIIIGKSRGAGEIHKFYTLAVGHLMTIVHNIYSIWVKDRLNLYCPPWQDDKFQHVNVLYRNIVLH